MLPLLAALLLTLPSGAAVAGGRGGERTSGGITTDAPHYRGGCAFDTVNDTLAGEPLGGYDQWTGEADLVAIAVDPITGVPLPTVEMVGWCDLYRNGYLLGTVLGPVEGTGAVEAHDVTFTFTAGFTDTVSMCANIILEGNSSYSCSDANRTPTVSHPNIATITAVLELVVWQPTDALNCWLLRVLAAAVNMVDPTVVYIDPSTGDVDLYGTSFWECSWYLPAGTSTFIILDLDSDGYDDAVYLDPLTPPSASVSRTDVGITRSVTPCVFSPPIQDLCTSWWRHIIATTISIGTAGWYGATMHVHDVDDDGEFEVHVVEGSMSTQDIDDDGDVDIVQEHWPISGKQSYRIPDTTRHCSRAALEGKVCT